MGCNVYIRTDLHEKMIRMGHNPAEFVNKTVEEALKKKRIKGRRDEIK